MATVRTTWGWRRGVGAPARRLKVTYLRGPGVGAPDTMPKQMDCADLGMDCGFKASGETTEEVVQKAAAHAQDVHGLEATPELAAKVQSVVREI